MAKRTYFIRGMHCPACETFIQKTVAGMKGVTNVKVSLADARITIDAESNQAIPSLHKLNQLFNKDGYSFTLQPEKQAAKLTAGQVALVLVIFAIIVGLFTYFTGSDMLASLNVNSGSSLPAFFLFGIAAGLSSCAALVGGMLLSVQEAWVGSTDGNDKNAVMPFVLFNGSRLAAFALLGGLLGALGGLFRISFTASALLTIAIALVMLIIGMQMIGVKFFQRIKLNFTGGLVSSVANKGNLGRTVMPILFGAVTFFVPCGFTLVAQSQALASGSFARGLGVMTAFALGTLPVLLAISYSSIKFYRNPRFANPFRLLSGLLVIFFALLTLNAQFGVLQLPSLQRRQQAAVAPIAAPQIQAGSPQLAPDPTATVPAPVVAADGTQVMQMEARGFEYFPKTISIKAGLPTRFEITDNGSVGCARAVYPRGLYPDVILLEPGLNVVEFTAPAAGTYQISCSMWMVDPITVIVE